MQHGFRADDSKLGSQSQIGSVRNFKHDMSCPDTGANVFLLDFVESIALSKTGEVNWWRIQHHMKEWESLA